jgi:predicted MFS family arabinose efflux permease
LVSLAAYGAAFTGYLFAASTEAFFAIRAFAGAFTAGLTPAMMGIVADILPENERAQWIGVVGSGSSVGWILGPAIGGMLFDKWGYAAPFTVSVLMAVIALGVAFFMVPETGTHIARRRIKSMRQNPATGNEQPTSIWHALPRPLSTFAVLLAITFIMIFSWAFTEPQLTVTIYEELGWTSARFGLLISGYGVAAFLGQMVLSRSSDRFGRLPIIMLGLLMHSAQYMGMMLTASFQLIMVSFVLAGLGEMTPQQHKSRIIGIKGSIGSLGSVIGPLLAVVASRSLAPQSVFLVSAVLLLLATLMILFTQKSRIRSSSRLVIQRP